MDQALSPYLTTWYDFIGLPAKTWKKNPRNCFAGCNSFAGRIQNIQKAYKAYKNTTTQ